jgi:hypothetical protein
MSDTPRTDAAQFDWSDDCTPEDGLVVAACDMQQLERELNEANADRLRLREAIDSAISYANGRESEWGSRAEGSFQYLYNALSSPPPPVVAKADADELAEMLNQIRAELPIEIENDILFTLETYNQKYKA